MLASGCAGDKVHLYRSGQLIEGAMEVDAPSFEVLNASGGRAWDKNHVYSRKGKDPWRHQSEKGFWLQSTRINFFIYSMTPANPPASIFLIPDQDELEAALRQFVTAKFKAKQPLTSAEVVFDDLVRMGGRIAFDGFVSLYEQWFTPESFARVCDALAEVGAIKLRELLMEAWSIFTKDRTGISLDELRRISIRRFNTAARMDRFDQIGDEVARELNSNFPGAKHWAVEYAMRHRAEFEPIKQT